MRSHIFKIFLAVIIITAFIFLPYVPGDYDEVVVTFSIMAQLFGMVSLLLVPVGIFWWAYEWRQRKINQPSSSIITKRFALTTSFILCFIGLVVAAGAFINSTVLAIITIVLCIALNSLWYRRLKTKPIPERVEMNSIPLYLIIIPTAVFSFRLAFIQKATAFSRNYAIQHSEPLIRDIETYHDKNGHYPISLLSLHEDYKPSIRGIRRFYYEPYGAAYNIYFEQFVTALGVREIVMYNKLDEHEFSSHNSDLLLLTPADIKMQRGYLSKRDLQHAHWKYFWFD